MAGYSATPLASKLGLKAGMRAWWPQMPASVRAQIDCDALALTELAAPEAPIDAAHVFVTRLSDLQEAIARIRPVLAPAGFLWVSWPKKSSGVPSEVTEHEVRRTALASELVDIKVCAVDEVWSGLKMVIPLALRRPLVPGG